ncbi:MULTISPECIES: 50S ribosomal protein L11 methyltransferase [Methylorubrum]|jgi:ribosomal protein L11 methyltransferase|uniref:Ribosomal protein L11 methyltransferase n=2 Tax=Methylorubrum extorquens TaxID=408 RepID=C5ASR9_METEA|nr:MULTISPECIES: 50S ribosomal protein L11 methyltransferase [Methylorubrum]ACS42532.1 Ribosomal protein L11 methyltransferase (L11 Mtase) [Methylorubrum extorquens AM1]EHP91556.1 ribosomal L11 methyltransferase [Methylorubrum extorquens DSM 13060]MCP1544398.1 ribosomal protein L11 methyltransferase [Methylorubrum extorquens]MCP1588257.1 ribosomal protein L11 methyltransferase [Methylorubrum extorquens]MCY1644179.1 50S ribosomal protein L11 methyltransferase [Methylorubrum sp. SL192]
MLEGLPPHRPTHVLRLITDEPSARAMTELLGEMFDPMETAVAAFEVEETGAWRLEAYFSEEPDAEMIRDLIRPMVGEQADAAVFETIDQQDWVRASLEGLKPVRAGRFLVHGGHDRHQVRGNDLAIEIEAALAFGTGHHGTTLGCLRALVDELKRRRPAHVLDVGTGTGILGFAAAKVLRTPVVAGDLDPEAVSTARGNARLNGLGPFMRFYHAPGVRHALANRPRGFDVVFANILARPLKRLAPSLTAVVADDGVLILSGLIERDVPGVLSTYRHRGFHLARSGVIEGWATLVLRRGGAAARPR